MESNTWNRPGISGGSCSASAFASAGDFNGKLRVKWLWLITRPPAGAGNAALGSSDQGWLRTRRHPSCPIDCPHLVAGPGESMLHEFLVRARQLHRSKFDS